ncbi:MAG: NADH-quinone oxidoreductase subunit J [Candidatus Koribacter versatilis]|uniref:NADH-quinone oxidoreductase subunit J n=1 Tax=Candidatus Korobacter versatilis TaxID=658062 RepID=A0A932A8X1_9BACT|nr:NADH-quinone oxidoreductase subunit J [Candidatus Koribacter versatilis]
MHTVLFIIFAVVCVAAAINLLAQRHPINSALSLIVVMGSLALLYLLLGAEFVAAVQIIIYAGAIMVLFVFTIMLLNAGEEELSKSSRVAIVFGVPAVAVIVAALAYILSRGAGTAALGDFIGGPKEIGRLLFRDFLLPFEVTSVLILIAIMGAVVLARREER